jgi:hypothetical protein
MSLSKRYIIGIGALCSVGIKGKATAGISEKVKE